MAPFLTPLLLLLSPGLSPASASRCPVIPFNANCYHHSHQMCYNGWTDEGCDLGTSCQPYYGQNYCENHCDCFEPYHQCPGTPQESY